MKVTIDTKEDSPEDIYKVLHILTNILQRKETGSQIRQGLQEFNPAESLNPGADFNSQSGFEVRNESPGGTSQVDTAPLMSLFDSPGSTGAASPQAAGRPSSGTAPDFSSFLNLTKQEANKENKEPQPRIEFY